MPSLLLAMRSKALGAMQTQAAVAAHRSPGLQARRACNVFRCDVCCHVAAQRPRYGSCRTSLRGGWARQTGASSSCRRGWGGRPAQVWGPAGARACLLRGSVLRPRPSEHACPSFHHQGQQGGMGTAAQLLPPRWCCCAPRPTLLLAAGGSRCSRTPWEGLPAAGAALPLRQLPIYSPTLQPPLPRPWRPAPRAG